MPADQSNVEGDNITPLSLSVQATESLGNTITYSATGLPYGLQLNASTGAIIGMINVGDANNSPYSVTVTASDGTYSSAESFNWRVGSPITITNPGDQTSLAGESIVPVQITATNSVSGTLKYVVTGLPSGLSVSSSGLISGTVLDSEAGAGEFPITVEMFCGPYSNIVSFNWLVLNSDSLMWTRW